MTVWKGTWKPDGTGGWHTKSDIVEQYNSARLTAAPAQMLKDAIDEVVRLRAENETLRRDVKTAVMGDSAELQDVKRENEKLRKILQALINDIEDYEHINNITPKFSKLCCIESIRNAREILKKTA